MKPPINPPPGRSSRKGSCLISEVGLSAENRVRLKQRLKRKIPTSSAIKVKPHQAVAAELYSTNGMVVANPKAKTRNLIIACGALAKEIKFLLHQLQVKNQLAAAVQPNQRNQTTKHNPIYDSGVDVVYLPAILHNRPQEITPAIDKIYHANKSRYHQIFIGYADCGSGGLLDQWLQQKKLKRLAGAHCYQFFAGLEEFENYMTAEIGSFFLTDYLTRHFDELIWQGMGLAQHPELLSMMFGHYKKLIYLAQTDDAQLTAMAQQSAKKLGLNFERRFTGYGLLADFIVNTLPNQTQQSR